MNAYCDCWLVLGFIQEHLIIMTVRSLFVFLLSLSRSISSSRRRILNLESCSVCKVLRAENARVCHHVSFPIS